MCPETAVRQSVRVTVGFQQEEAEEHERRHRALENQNCSSGKLLRLGDPTGNMCFGETGGAGVRIVCLEVESEPQSRTPNASFQVAYQREENP